MEAVRRALRPVADFPRPGVCFYDVTPLLGDGALFAQVIEAWAQRYQALQIGQVAGIESRGFIFGAALAHRLRCGFVPLRKPGKLPGETYRAPYALEYGTSCLHMHRDALRRGERVLVCDDLIATGGTAAAACALVAQASGVVHEVTAVVELEALGGRRSIAAPVFGLLTL